MMSNFFLSSTRTRAALYGGKHLIDYFFHREFRSPFRIAVDITNRCNLNCKTCYWRKETQRKELSDEQWEKIIDRIVRKSPSIMQAAWLGGEPMLRFKLIKKLARRFPFNHIVTNGTIPLVPMKGLGYTVSVDGTKSYHEMQRGKSYDKIKDNLRKTKAKNINLLYVISSLNKDSIKDFVREWSKINSVSRIIFSFYSVNLFQQRDPLWIDFDEQDEIIDQLSKLSRFYPKMRESVKHLHCLKGKHRKRAVRRCLLAKSKNICLNSSGKIKYTAYGKKRGLKISCESQDTDCSRCGVSCVSRYCYMSHNRLGHLKKVFSRHPPVKLR